MTDYLKQSQIFLTVKVEFTLNLNHAMGPRTSRATEVQTMRANSVPGHIYNVDVETTNADIPYAEYFSVLTHYCIVKVGLIIIEIRS
jgi:hypothetical protein